jgi:DNA-directed RNA polymerase beta subunit
MNDKFKKNDILAYHEKFFTKGSDGVVRLNVGPIAKVAFTSAFFTYEDSGMMTEKFSKKLATSITMCETIKLDATANVEKIVKVGDEVEVGEPLVVLGLGDTGDKSVDNFLKAFRADSGSSIIDAAKRTFKAKHAGKIVDVKMYTVKSLDKLSPSLYEILDAHFKENEKRKRMLDKHDKTNSVYKLDTLYDRATGPLKGQEIKGITTDVLIEVFIEHEDFQSIGDKLVAFSASKQVIGEMVPEGKEPYSELHPDEEISVFVSARSILKRMIPSICISAAGNKVLIETKRAIQKIWES